MAGFTSTAVPTLDAVEFEGFFDYVTAALRRSEPPQV
jgi:hypothetical protein